jgi:indolepyruvate ferredoxin oxidoreductase beta subunit
VIPLATRILIASVGGQGGLTLARVLAFASVLSGFSVRTGETLGMAQRYGSVVSYVQIGSRVYTPKFTPGEADYLVGLELVESIRNIHYLKPSGFALVADEYRPPYTLSVENPLSTRDQSLDLIKSLHSKTIIIPARKLAVEVGNPRALNIVMLGSLNAVANIFSHKTIEEAIKQVLPARVVESSIKAYIKGYEYTQATRQDTFT